MTTEFHPEVLLACLYALFLSAVAAGLELLARHTHRRSEQYHLAGFKYHHRLDAWECPTGQHLHRRPERAGRGQAHYRAPAHVCNACAIKSTCTDSDEGRQITRSSLRWLESEVGRFQRGISLALLLLAQFILTLELLRFQTAPERLLIGSLLLTLAVSWLKMLVRFRTDARTATRDYANSHGFLGPPAKMPGSGKLRES